MGYIPSLKNLSSLALSILPASGEHTALSTLPFETGSPIGLDLAVEVKAGWLDKLG